MRLGTGAAGMLAGLIAATAVGAALVSPTPGAAVAAKAPVPKAAAAKAQDALCAADYAHGPTSPGRLRFGIDPEPAGSVGTTQLRAEPSDPAKAIKALHALRPPGRELVLRVNRLFEADGESGIRRFKRIIARYTRAGFDTELQVRYHPTAAQRGNMPAWIRFVRHVVDVLGPDRHLIAMTITNEINLRDSPNTSDGAYPRAEDALIQGIVAAHREALARGFRTLRFGFTFAYRFNPTTDAALFTGLRRGGSAFRRALGFVGVDYYPELYPGLQSRIGIPAATTQMMATMRRCFMRLGGLGPRIPLWITESGFDTTPGVTGERRQRTALVQIVDAVRSAARSYGVTDYRWFNLRDNLSTSTGFAQTSGLLTDRYRRKPAFAAYRRLISRFGAAGR